MVSWSSEEVTPEIWARIKSLFEAASEMERDERAAFLSQNCSEQSVRVQVERLLTNHDRVGNFLAEPAFREVLEPLDDPLPPRLTPGSLLADRFKIVRFVAEGGMGEVYEAQDLELHEHLGLKTLRTEILSQPSAIERFKREVHLARKVTHPNICRVFDLFRDKSTGSHELVFVTMEFLRGETLAEHLKRQGRMSPDESLPLIKQMASGLSAAHQAGIVHRDFKPGNVVLVEEGGGSKAVITDFGLAFRGTKNNSEASNSAAWNVSETGNLYGTPAYMAPEQIEGEPASVASDIYALGLVMYEMVTGSRPFSGSTPISAAAKRLVELPPTPRKFDSTLSPVWESVILKCLEREPSKRFADAHEVADALASNIDQTDSLRHSGRRHLVVIASLVLVLIAGLAIAHRTLTHTRPLVLPSSGPDAVRHIVKLRPAVAVLGFKNLSHNVDADWLSTALSETLTTELASGERVRTIPGEEVARERADLSLPDEESFTRDTLARIRTTLGTDFVVFGSYLDLGKESGGQLRVDLRLQDARAGETLASISITGTETQLLQVILRAGGVLREKLGVGEVSASDSEALRASTPQNQEVARLYGEGLERLWAFDALKARDLLEKAVALESDFVLSHDALAQAWLNLGYETKAAAEAKRAFDLSQKLRREDRLSIEGRYRETTHEWQKAIELYGALFQFYPDNLEYGLRLAKMQRVGGKAKDALQTVRTLRTLPAPVGDDPRIDIAEADIDIALGDFKQSASVSHNAAERAGAAGQPFLLASAKLDECWAAQKLGQYKESIANCDLAGRTYSQAGDHDQEARAILDGGAALREAGDFAGAVKAYDDALALFRQVGDKLGIAYALNNMAVALSAEGEHQAAEKKYEQALAIVHEVDSKPSSASLVGNIAGELKFLGNLVQAGRRYDEAVVLDRELGNQSSEAWALKGLGSTLYLRGELREAEQALNHSLQLCQKVNVKRTCGFALENLGDLFMSEGKLEQAEAKYQAALSVWSDAKNQGDMAESQLQLAALAIEEGRPADADKAVRQAREVFQSLKWTGDEIWADVVLARALLAENQPAEAEKELDLARGKKLENEEVRLELALAGAQLSLALGTPAELSAARQNLATVLQEARVHEFVELAFEARLAMAQIEMKNGHAISGRARLDSLEKDARNRGFVLIADKAARAARR